MCRVMHGGWLLQAHDRSTVQSLGKTVHTQRGERGSCSNSDQHTASAWQLALTGVMLRHLGGSVEQERRAGLWRLRAAVRCDQIVQQSAPEPVRQSTQNVHRSLCPAQARVHVVQASLSEMSIGLENAPVVSGIALSTAAASLWTQAFSASRRKPPLPTLISRVLVLQSPGELVVGLILV